MLRVQVLILAAALPVAAEPAWGGEALKADVSKGPSCQTPHVVEALGQMHTAVVRAVSMESKRDSLVPAAPAVVLNGRGYNYGPPPSARGLRAPQVSRER